MVAATYCPEPCNKPQVLVSVEQLRGYFREAETELYRSQGFRKLLAEFKQRGTLTTETQAMVRAMCREAIRSTLRQVCSVVPNVRQGEPDAASAAVSHLTLQVRPSTSPCPSLPVQAPDLMPTPLTGSTSSNLAPPAVNLSTVPGDHAAANPSPPGLVPDADHPASPSEQSDSSQHTFNLWQWWRDRQTKPYVPTPEELRQTQLHTIGKLLQEARLAKGLPLEAIHQRTLIARHQIRAIEAGEGRWLPEDIYLKGFIRRMGDELGLDGQAIANQLTPLPSPASVRPSWHQHSPAIAPSRVDPTRLYVGYAAVVAGSVWGLSWVSQHPLNLAHIPAFPETGILPASPTPQTASQGLTLQPRATVDSTGNIKIQFSNRQPPSPDPAPQKAAMEG